MGRGPKNKRMPTKLRVVNLYAKGLRCIDFHYQLYKYQTLLSHKKARERYLGSGYKNSSEHVPKYSNMTNFIKISQKFQKCILGKHQIDGRTGVAFLQFSETTGITRDKSFLNKVQFVCLSVHPLPSLGLNNRNYFLIWFQ